MVPSTVATQCRCPLIQVEGNVVVPWRMASQKEKYAAATFRPKITLLLDRFLHSLETLRPERSSLGLDLPTRAGKPPDALLVPLNLDHTVPASGVFTRGGTPKHTGGRAVPQKG